METHERSAPGARRLGPTWRTFVLVVVVAAGLVAVIARPHLAHTPAGGYCVTSEGVATRVSDPGFCLESRYEWRPSRLEVLFGDDRGRD